MEALIYRGPWQLAVEDAPAPGDPVHNEVLVRIRATGICGTDVGIISGQYQAVRNVVLGHESAGEVVAIGPDVSSRVVGERVVIDPTYYCSLCRMCRTGRRNHCERKIGTETGVSRDGTFATYYKTEDRFLYPIGDGIGFEAATLTEPLSCALTGVDQLRTRPDLRTVVLGAGPIGIVYTHALHSRAIGGALVEISPERRSLARHVLPTGWSCSNSIRDAVELLSPDTGTVDLVVDTTGVLCAECIPLLARGGQFLAVGLRQFTCNLDMNRVADESLSIQGSIDSLGTFAAAAHLINSKAVPAESIVTHTLALEEYVDGFALLGCDIRKQQRNNHAQALKTVLRPC